MSHFCYFLATLVKRYARGAGGCRWTGGNIRTAGHGGGAVRWVLWPRCLQHPGPDPLLGADHATDFSTDDEGFYGRKTELLSIARTKGQLDL